MAKWIIVVDDDMSNLKIAGHILSKNQMRVTCLKSGKALINYIGEGNRPDLILLDIMMPEMDGFETLTRLREKEKELDIEEIPVIFLTADEAVGSESRGFEMGVSDYIRKPFNPDVLLMRIKSIVSKRDEMLNLKSEASIDQLTGLLNKGATGVVFSKYCSTNSGMLMMIDLDSFKLVNDIYGHDMGDKILIAFANIINANITEGSRAGRVGGDEFTAFVYGYETEDQLRDFTERLNEQMLAEAKRLMGEDMDIPLGVSVGGVLVPKYGTDYEMLLALADKALYNVKKNGKHGYLLYSDAANADDDISGMMDIDTISEILGERSIPNVALQLDKDVFAYVYRYVMRYNLRNSRTACKILFTINDNPEIDDAYYNEMCDEFGNHIKDSLRKSDIFMRGRNNQYFVFLTEVREDSYNMVSDNLINKWYEEKGNKLKITYEASLVSMGERPVSR